MSFEGGAPLRRALLPAVAVMVLWLVVEAVLAAVLPPLSRPAFPDLGAVIVNLGALSVLLGVVRLRGWTWREVGLGVPGPTRAWALLLPLLLIALSFAIPGLAGSGAQVISSVVLFAVLGVNEELLGRGIVQRLLTPLGAARCVLGVALLFGVQHAANALFFGQSALQSAPQVVSNVAFGAAYAAARRRLATIWPLAALHALEDFCITRSPGDGPRWWYVAAALLYAAYATVLVRAEPPTGKARAS